MHTGEMIFRVLAVMVGLGVPAYFLGRAYGERKGTR
jgi:hypothetical protein